MKTKDSIDTYIAQYPPDVQERLETIRTLVRKEAPDAIEKISYGLATFALRRNLVHFGAFPRHIGFYPGASGVAAFEKDLASYVHAKGSIQFPLDRPLPLPLIRKIVQFRVKEEKGHARGVK